MLILIGCSSMSGTKEGSDSVVHPERVVDSIRIVNIQTIDVFDCVDSMWVVVNNPYSDTLFMDNRFQIHQSDSNIVIKTGFIPNIQVPPKSVATFNISLGLDSVVYRATNSYAFTFQASGKNVDVVYFDTINLGNRYKKNGKAILEPFFEIVTLPLLSIPDTDKTLIHESSPSAPAR